MRAKFCIAATIEILCLAGCAPASVPWQSYAGPPENTSEITIFNTGKDFLFPQAFTDPINCIGMRHTFRSIKDGGPMSEVPTDKEIKFVVERNKVFSLRSAYAFMNANWKFCAATITFVPTKAQYRLVGMETNHDGQWRCGIRIFESDMRPFSKYIARKSIFTPWSSDSSWCEPMTDMERHTLESYMPTP